MPISWRVVLDDGTRPFGPDIMIDQRRPLRLVSGEDVIIEISLIDPVGGEVQIGAGEFLLLDARTASYPNRNLISARSTRAGLLYRLTIAGDVTRTLKPQRATFDLWAIRTTGRTNLIPLSSLEIAPSALGNNYQ